MTTPFAKTRGRPRKTDNPDIDPINAIDDMAARRLLFRGAPLDPELWSQALFGDAPIFPERQIWKRPPALYGLPVDAVIEKLVRRQIIAFEAGRTSPYYAARRAIADACGRARAHWMEYSAARQRFDGFRSGAEALMAAARAIVAFQRQGIEPRELATDYRNLPLNRLLAQHAYEFESMPLEKRRDMTALLVAQGDMMQARTDEMGEDFDTIMRTAGEASRALARISARSEIVVDQLLPKHRRADQWSYAFATVLTGAWVSLTNRSPSREPDTFHHQFVFAAYQSLGGRQRRHFTQSIRAVLDTIKAEAEALGLNDPLEFPIIGTPT